jgi:hypothetical protein
MKFEDTKSSGLADIGQRLLAHSRQAEFTARRGAVVELFPYLVAAHERMSARAIARFLEKEQGIKLSAVTITKALNDPKKYWNQFFDTIEPHVKIYENWDRTETREKFLYDDKAFKVMLPNLPGRDLLRKALAKYEFAQAINALREKWFSIDLGIRIKARPYLAERLLGKVKQK